VNRQAERNARLSAIRPPTLLNSFPPESTGRYFDSRWKKSFRVRQRGLETTNAQNRDFAAMIAAVSTVGGFTSARGSA